MSDNDDLYWNSLRNPHWYFAVTICFVIYPAGLILSVLLYFERNHTYVQARGGIWWLLVINFSYMVFGGGPWLSYLIYSNGRCVFYVVCSFLGIGFYGFPYLVRCAIFAFKFQRNKRLHVRYQKFESCFTRNPWLLRPSFLIPLFVFVLAVHSIPAVLYFSVVNKNYNPLSCSLEKVIYGLYVFYGVYVIGCLVFVYTLFGSSDNYHIRHEFIGVSSVWAVFGVSWIISVNLRYAHANSAWFIDQYLANGSLFISLAFIVSFWISSGWLYYLCIRTSRGISKSESLTELVEHQSFEGVLSDPTVRANFRSFLCLQFCVENLVFWEAVQQFKTQIFTDHEMSQAAQDLYAKFIDPRSIDAVNITSPTRNEISDALATKHFHTGMFDKANVEVLAIMRNDSYVKFVTSPATNRN